MTNSVADNILCTGCAGCSIACPRQAVTMTQNEKGFLFPTISPDKCIQCGICLSSCHLHNNAVCYKPLSLLAAKNKSSEERTVASSGGIFLLLAKHIINQNGVVYGAAFDNHLNVKHIRATTIDDVLRCCQSKYVQSDAVDALQNAIQDIENGKKTMFVGTPCQVSALRLALKNKKIDQDNMLMVDFVCHGTPSPKVFSDYLKMLEEKYKGTIIKFFFRDKEQGWRGNGYKAIFSNRDSVINGFYMRGYNKLFPLATNDACFECRYSKPERMSDITLGDFWGIENTPVSNFEDKLGVSIITINTAIGEEWVNKIVNEIEMVNISLDYCKNNTPLFHHPEKSPSYDAFWAQYLRDGYRKTFDLYCKFSGKKGLYERLKWIIMYRLNLKDKILQFNSKYMSKTQV